MKQPNTPESTIPINELENDLKARNDGSNTADLSAKTDGKSHLDLVLRTYEDVNHRKKSPLRFSPPIISRLGEPIIYPNTVNMIQGQSGVHKSRLSQQIVSGLLACHAGFQDPLAFDKDESRDYFLVYVDTERNLTEQYPYAIQSIQKNAGFNIADDLPNFHFTSLLHVERTERYVALGQYLEYLRKSTANKHMFVILDVLPDCVCDFNRPDESLRLMDFLNHMVNKFDCTFLCTIHENPGQSKARGHLGTELFNKSSTVIQIVAEKDGEGNSINLFRINFLKCRQSAPHKTLFVKLCPSTAQLILADGTDLSSKSRQEKAPDSEVVSLLEELFEVKRAISKKELLMELNARFCASSRTLMDRLERVITKQINLYIQRAAFILNKRMSGKQVEFFITPTSSHDLQPTLQS